MIKVTSLSSSTDEKVEVVLFADSKSDVTDDMEIVGMPDGAVPAPGSSVITADGDVGFLKSDGTWSWVEGGGGSGSSSLYGLTDVDITNPEDGQVLKFNATTGKWENGTGGGSGEKFVITGSDFDYYSGHSFTSDKTYAEISAAYESGQQLVLSSDDFGGGSGGSAEVPLAFVEDSSDANPSFVFQFTYDYDGELRFFRYSINSSYCSCTWWTVYTD